MNKKEHKKIEKAKLLKSIRDNSVIGRNYDAIKDLILTPEDDRKEIEHSITGLSEEDEFSLICNQMKTVTHLIPLEQRPFISGDYIVPDFLARFQPGCSIFGYTKKDSKGYKCFIDVKSTNKNKIKIGGSKLKRLRNFANEFGYPLLFAVRFLRFTRNALWIIIHDEDESKLSISISIEDLLNQIRYILWDEYWYLIPFDIKFRSIANSQSSEKGVITPYGVQEKFEVITGNKVLTFEKEKSVGASAFFEAFNLEEEEKVKIDEKYTAQILKPNLYVCSMVDMIYNLNILPQDEYGVTTHNPSKTIRQLEKPIFDIEMVQNFASGLEKSGVLYYAGFTDKENHLKTWVKYGGVPRGSE